MSKFSSLFKRLQRLEPSPKYIEPWPPKEGTIEWLILKSREADGLETPDKPNGETGFMYLARLEAPRLWDDDHVPD
jgi:hypothetical protein